MNAPRTYAKSPELEAAVIADPENDLPRLVYADWLDEHDDPHRAAFIRAQCALWDKNPADEDYPDWVESLRISRRCLPGRRDLDPVVPPEICDHAHPYLVDETYDQPRDGYHRGFPSCARPTYGTECSHRTASAFARALVDVVRTTSIRGVSIDGGFRDYANVILATPVADQISIIDADSNTFEGRTAKPVIESVVTSAAISSLRWLRLSTINSEAEARLLARTDFPQLRHFAAGGLAQADAQLVRELFKAPWLKSVSRFESSFGEAEPTRIGVRAMAKMPALHTFISYATGDLFEAFSLAGKFNSLGRLHLWRGSRKIGACDKLALAKWPHLSSFTCRQPVSNDDLIALSVADWFGQLHQLELTGPLGDKSIAAMAERPIAESLRILKLEDNQMKTKGLQTLATRFPNLTTLCLYEKRAAFPKQALNEFFSRCCASRLRHLELNAWLFGDAEAIAFAKNPAFAALRILKIDGGQFGAKGIKAILNSPHLQRLTSLSVSSMTLQLNRSVSKTIAEVLKDPGVMPHLVGWR